MPPSSPYPKAISLYNNPNDPLLLQFAKKALIRGFQLPRMPIPSPKLDYNDDVHLPFYSSSSRTYADKQRRGLQEEHTECSSIEEHVKAALKAPFFLALHTPLPSSLSKAISFVSECAPELVTSFWEKQLGELTKLASDASDTNESWKKLIPTEIRPAAGKLNLPALMSLMDQFGLGGSNWLQQFLFGFKLTGVLSQRFAFPSAEKAGNSPILSPEELVKNSSTRFTERAAKSGFKNGSELWLEAIEQHKLGWLTAPFPLASVSEPFVLLDKKLNIAFRFGVSQADKLRACDDLRYSLTNLACVVHTPIKLASWDHLAEMCRLVQDTKKDWHLFKADHEAAYKQLPLEWSQSKLAVVALRRPSDGRWFGFFSRTLLFGAIAAVIHYNVFSRIISELMCRLFGIPMISYFDDFAALLPSSLAASGLDTFSRWCSIMGITLKLKKSEVGPHVTFLGLLGSFPSVKNHMKLRVSLTEEKANKWADSIRKYLQQGLISSSELDKLIGKLCFSQTCLFGKFARTQLRCLYKKLHAPRYIAKLAKHEILTLNWWIDVLISLKPRIPRGPNTKPDFVLYTDAASSTNRIAALLFKGNSSPPTVLELTMSIVPSFWLKQFNPKNVIFGLEMLAALAFIWQFRFKLKGKALNLYIDNNNVLTTLVRGDSGTNFLAAMIACFWRISEAFSIDIWLGRVHSKLNPADLPTRHTAVPFPVKNKSEFRELFRLLQLTKKWCSFLH